MKKILSLIVACIVAFSMSGMHSFVKADTGMTARQQVEAMTVGWNLGNTLDSYGTWINNVNPQAVETAWGNPVTTRQMIAAVRARGFNTIRIPVTWAQFTDDNGNVDPSWMARVREVVDWSLEEGLYVILNVHHDTGEHGSDKVCWLIADTGTYSSVQNRFANLWTNIANEFKDYDDRLMFEGYNEMLDMSNSWNAPTTGNGAYDAVNSFAQLFVDTVRATGGNNATRNLIVNTYVASVDQNVLSNFVLPVDTVSDHLIVEVHAYTPYQFCSVQGDSSYTSFDDNCRSAVDGMLNAVASFSDSLGVPVIIGEFGVENKNNDSDRTSYVEYYMQQASSRGIRCIYWDNGIMDYGGYGILDRNSLTWNESIASALIDNAPSGQDAQVAVTEETIESTAELTQETNETFEETSEAVQSTLETSSETSLESAEIDSNSPNINGHNTNIILLLIVGAVVVVTAYAGLFLLGRKNGRKQ